MKKRRDWLLGTAVAGVIAALTWGSLDSVEEPLRAVRSDRRIETAAAGADMAPLKSRPAATRASSAAWPTAIVPPERPAWPKPSLQGLVAWGEPSPTPTPSAPPPPPIVAPLPPQAPPFPYELIGMLEEGGRPQALLNGSIRVLTVHAGDVVDGQWQVDSIQTGQLSLTWLPSNLPLTVGYRAPRP